MISSIVSRLIILIFGTLYPAYASYKAVRTKNVKEYVKWMMYWIVFALFTCAETFTDVFLSFWFPFYYEIKILLVLWLLSPATKGSSILYRRFVHPTLSRKEAEIDEALARATEQGYTAVLHLGTKGVNYATTVLMQTAIKNLPNVVPNVITASQSDSAISSLANRRTTSRHRQKDSTDGFVLTETPSPPLLRPRIKINGEFASLNDVEQQLQEEHHFQTTSDEDAENETNDVEEIFDDVPVSDDIIFKLPTELESKSDTQNQQQQPVKKTRKPRKEKSTLREIPTRRKITRSSKENIKYYEGDFSDGFDFDKDLN